MTRICNVLLHCSYPGRAMVFDDQRSKPSVNSWVLVLCSVWSSHFSGWNSNTSMTMQICEEQIWNANCIAVGRMFVTKWPNTTVTIEIHVIWITASSRGFHISGYPRHSLMYNNKLLFMFIYHCINVYDISLTYNGQPSHFHVKGSQGTHSVSLYNFICLINIVLWMGVHLFFLLT